MRELIAVARNNYHRIVGDLTETTIEAVLTVRNRKLEFLGGSLVPIDELETVRFGMTIEGAQLLADDLVKWIETAKEEKRRIEGGL